MDALTVRGLPPTLDGSGDGSGSGDGFGYGDGDGKEDIV